MAVGRRCEASLQRGLAHADYNCFRYNASTSIQANQLARCICCRQRAVEFERELAEAFICIGIPMHPTSRAPRRSTRLPRTCRCCRRGSNSCRSLSHSKHLWPCRVLSRTMRSNGPCPGTAELPLDCPSQNQADKCRRSPHNLGPANHVEHRLCMCTCTLMDPGCHRSRIAARIGTQTRPRLALEDVRRCGSCCTPQPSQASAQLHGIHPNPGW